MDTQQAALLLEQKAELEKELAAKNHELEIEAALEKVRSRALAMHHSNELREVVAVVFETLQALDLALQNTGAVICTFTDGSKDHTQWIADGDQSYAIPFKIPNHDNPLSSDIFSARKSGKDFFSKLYTFETKNEYFNVLFASSDFRQVPDEVKKMILESRNYGFSIALAKNSAILVPTNTGILLSESEATVLKRFANVFDQAYVRFLDLQKAEAQAREARVQLALERVRAIALSMKEPADMLQVCRIIATELDKLGVKEIRNVQTAVFYESSGTYINYEYYAKHNKTIITETSYTNHKTHQAFADQMLKGKGEFYTTYISKSELPAWIAYQKTTNVFIDSYLETASSLNYYWFSLGPVALGISAYITLNEEAIDLFSRFLKVFELAYTRFLDIEQAITQAREAKIEAALERVRARAMAMHSSQELQEVVKELRKQIALLGQNELDTCVIQLYDESPDYIHSYASMKPRKNSEDISDFYRLTPKKGLLIIEESLQAYFSGRKEYILLNEKDKLIQWIDFIKETYPDIYAVFVETIGSEPEKAPVYWSFSDFNGGSLLMATLTPPADISRILLRKFANVFGMAYRRFVDLKQAEAQAREAQIQLALERVRARTMAMQKSNELADVAGLLFKQVSELGIKAWTTGFNVWSDDNNSFTDYITSPQGGFIEPYTVDAPLPTLRDARKRGEEFFVFYLEGEILKDAYRQLSKFGEKQFKSIVENGFDFPTHQYNHFVFGTKVSLMFITYEPVPEAHDIFKRFGKVFEQTYTRFLDLQRAEAQAREATIEAALERVRSRSMAMHKSDEAMDVAVTVYEQLQKLDFKFGASTIIIMDEKTGNMEHWLAGFIQKNHVESYQVNNSEHLLHAAQLAAWREGAKFVSVEMSGPELKSYAQEMFTQTGYRNLPDEEKAMLLENEHAVFNLAYMSHGALMWAPSALSNENATILQRFAKVFEQTYTRFLDLQRAEAQAREAQIEAALERVRSRTMAMQHSSELGETSFLLVKQIKTLGIDVWGCAFNIFNEEEKNSTEWFSNEEGYQPTYKLPREGVFLRYYEAAQRGESFHVEEFAGEKIAAHYRYLSTLPVLGDVLKRYSEAGISIPTFQIDNVAYFKHGYLLFVTQKPVPESYEIFKRFAAVFEQTYTRFLDLQKAEAQAREARIQLALERIRSRSLAMHHSHELKDVVAILFQQLKILGLEFDGGAAITLFSENSKDAIILVATPELSSPIQVNLPYDEEAFVNNPIILDVWNAKETGKNILNRFYSLEEKNKYFEYVFKHNNLQIIPQSSRDIILCADSYTASFIAEKNSLLGANSWSGQLFSEDDFNVLKRIAKVFEQAYIRFLDLQKAEALALRAEQDLIEIKAARKKAEDTLTELKATQAQLIQAEKMASLGQLTAGIAHEIQNPLNFVNNFSEVNAELIEELNAERSKVKSERNEELEKEILNEIKENEQKIIYHGKRADAIVKSMLQHTRASTGKKEPTDISALADEYLRLSYHGLRTKDQSFNAIIETRFDKDIARVEVIPQDIGRVLLNLFSNAFYAVNEKKKQQLKGYEPTVTISTKKRLNDKIEIRVKDNGVGIPQKLADKIFQPFFTTKPTGQGTGLGLSLSYDIVKAHGGEIKVESKEGEYSTFIIHLPVLYSP